MRRDSAKASSASSLAWLSVCSDSVGSSIVKMEYLLNDLKGSTDNCLCFTVTCLQNPTQSFPIFPATLFHYHMRMLLCGIWACGWGLLTAWSAPYTARVCHTFGILGKIHWDALSSKGSRHIWVYSGCTTSSQGRSNRFCAFCTGV